MNPTILRARRLIVAGNFPAAAQALADLVPVADWHDQRTLAAVTALLGINQPDAALAVLDGHTGRNAWALPGLEMAA